MINAPAVLIVTGTVEYPQTNVRSADALNFMLRPPAREESPSARFSDPPRIVAYRSIPPLIILLFPPPTNVCVPILMLLLPPRTPLSPWARLLSPPPINPYPPVVMLLRPPTMTEDHVPWLASPPPITPRLELISRL